MRVAVVLPHPLQPVSTGDRVRTAHLLRGLAELDVDAWLVNWCWGEDRIESPRAVQVEAMPRGLLRRLVWRGELAIRRRRDPLSIYMDPKARQRLLTAVDGIKPDVIDFQHSFMWMRATRPSVVTFHNVESQRKHPGVAAKALTKIALRERMAIDGSSAIVALSPVDRIRLEQMCPKEAHKIREVPVGYGPRSLRTVPMRPVVRRLCFVGSFPYGPNLRAARRLLRDWDEIRRRTQVESLSIIGRGADQWLKAAPGVEIHSDVADVGEILMSCDLLLVPLDDGGGVRVKIIEAFALGLPVVSTPIGYEGLEAVPGVHLEEATGLEEIVAAIDRLQPMARRKAIAENARELWYARYRPQDMASRMVQVYAELVN